MGYLDALSGPAAGRIVNKWSGPYFPSPSARSSVAQGGSGYVCDMVTSMTGPSDTIVTEVSWPADPWGNPFVVYLIKIDEGVDPSSGERITEIGWLENASQEANYRRLVVSYGPNGVPGGSADEAFMNEAIVNLAKPYRLFKEYPGETGKFIALDSHEYTTPMLSQLDNEAYGYLGNDNPDYDWVPGIQNGAPFEHDFSGDIKFVLGSDDIIIVIR